MNKFQDSLKIKWPIVFLWSMGVYYLLVLNQHFNIPLRIIPWLLIAFALVIYSRNKSVSDNFYRTLLTTSSLTLIKPLLVSLSIVILGFLLASTDYLSDKKGIYDLTTIFLGPIILGLLALSVVPKEIKTVQFLCTACVFAILFLALTDTIHYARDWYRMGRFADDSSHRWFGDGYIFFIPWLLLAYIKANSRLKQAAWLISIFWIFLLLSGTGSRAVMVVILIEITLFMSFYRRRPRAFLLPFILIGSFVLGALLLAPQQISGAIQRGTLVRNRIYDAWLPTIDFIRNSPWVGHGFGPNPWNQAYADFLVHHQAWPGFNFGGPHNLILDVAFIGGILTAVAFIYLSAWIVWVLFRLVRKALLRLRVQHWQHYVHSLIFTWFVVW